MGLYNNIRQWQTRLVLLKPSSDDTARLELSLVVVDLVELSVGVAINREEIIAYDALSYTWGTADPSVECICNGTVILLRDNLASALRHLRRPHSERYVWVDFLCINQQNEQEKDIQIPHMQTIYSRASGVMIWLGDSPVIDGIAESCRQDCGPDTELLVCDIHKEKLWIQIMEFEWFQRTWVRQEVYAARNLKVCTHHFVITWERFTTMLSAMKSLHASFNQVNLRNHGSLIDTYHSLRHFNRQNSIERLLHLLKQGTGFQASRVQDHIFSILGMVPLPKDRSSLIPITSGKSYEELCGDVVRLIIRETGHIDILQLCPLQRNTSYALNWPMINWSFEEGVEMQPGDMSSRDDFTNLPRKSNHDDWFNVENPIRDAVDLHSSFNADPSSGGARSIETRHLVLYGHVWGTLSVMSPQPLFFDSDYLPAYLAEDKDNDQELIATEVKHEHVITIHIYKRLRSLLPDMLHREEEDLMKWQCRGNVREGDLFVSLEPGPRNVLLRNAQGNVFDIVGWGGVTGLVSWREFRGRNLETEYSVADMDLDRRFIFIGRRRQFKIR